MDENRPPRIALWLIAQFASTRYRESLAGDLIEQVAHGRGTAWVWRQVFVALLIAPLGFLQRAPWLAALKAALLALGLITLGFGTLSWASDVQRHPVHELRR